MTTNNTIAEFLKKHEPDMFTLLENMVEIQSGSYNKEGVDRVAHLIQSSLKNNHLSFLSVEQKEFGNHLIARSVCREPENKQVLMVGHMDTVFPKDTSFNRYKSDDKYCYGPGVIDMKGGLVAGIYAIKALDKAGLLEKIPITFIFNSDEEIGSKTSKKLIRKEAKKSLFAFVMECGGRAGEVVTGRKGNISIKLDIKGKAGHAAFAGKTKASAILEFAHKTIKFESLNDPGRGISANVGQVTGGIGPNTVPENCSARIDFRFPDQAGYEYLKSQIENTVNDNTVSHTKSAFKIMTQRPPMPPNAANHKLFEIVQKTGAQLGYDIEEEFRQGVSDANLIADENIPVIDGLGPMGADDHSDKEHMLKESLIQRATLIACSVIGCWREFTT